MRLALLLGAWLLAGCPAAHNEFPTTTCAAQSDCFQGEICQIATGQDTGKCVADGSQPDGSTP